MVLAPPSAAYWRVTFQGMTLEGALGIDGPCSLPQCLKGQHLGEICYLYFAERTVGMFSSSENV